jgi:2-iminoacetate synthase
VSAVPITLESRPDRVPDGTAAAAVMTTDVAGLRAVVATATDADVERALGRPRRGLADFAALLSDAAAGRLEDLAQVANQVSVARFGRTVRLFSPLYLSNLCVSTCTYCGFSAGNDIARRTLSVAEVEAEAAELHRRGFRHLLLVAGEHARIINRDYLVDCVRAVAPSFAQVGIEVQVWDTDTYHRLLDAGCDGVTVYQEAYDPDTYAAVHLKGKKRNYAWRLAAPDRAAAAGMRRLAVGALLGLHPDWQAEAIALAAHAQALVRRWWRCDVSVALPRLRPAAGGYEPANPINDRGFVQLLCALRIVLPDVGISLSTREPAALRDALVPLGVTTMSAGSHTEPGGYATDSDAEPQFEISDTRSPAEVAAALRAAGYDPVWKDWQRA